MLNFPKTNINPFFSQRVTNGHAHYPKRVNILNSNILRNSNENFLNNNNSLNIYKSDHSQMLPSSELMFRKRYDQNLNSNSNDRYYHHFLQKKSSESLS